MKTNALRILDELNIPYELRSYDVDPDDLSAETVARKSAWPPNRFSKPCFERRSQRALFRRGARKLPTRFEGISPIDRGSIRGSRGPERRRAAHRLYPRRRYRLRRAEAVSRFVDETIELWDRISVSAGVRGTQVLLTPADFLRASGATRGPIAR